MVRKQTNKQAIQQTGEQNKHTHKQNKQSKTKQTQHNTTQHNKPKQTKQTNTRKPAALVARVEVAGVLGDQLEHLEVTDLRQPRDSARQHSNNTRQSAMRHAPFHPPPPPPTP
jgi:hypothetical protein